MAVSLAERSRAFDRVAKDPHRFVRSSRPLHGDPAVRFRSGRETIRMDDALHASISRLERSTIERIPNRQVKEGKWIIQIRRIKTNRPLLRSLQRRIKAGGTNAAWQGLSHNNLSDVK